MDDEKRTPSREEQVKKEAQRLKILDRLNSMDTGASRYEREQEERRGREIDVARAKERRWGSGV